MKRRTHTLTRQVSVFPVLMLINENDDTGQITYHPLPVELQWQLTLKWLALLLLGWLSNVWHKPAAVWRSAAGDILTNWRLRVSLEIGIALILGRQLGLVAVGR